MLELTTMCGKNILSNTDMSLIIVGMSCIKLFVLLGQNLSFEFFVLCVIQYCLQWAGDGSLVGV